MINENTPAVDSKKYITDIKVKLSEAITKVIQSKKLKQSEVQEILDIKQPRVSDLMNGKVDKFSIDSLLEYLNKIGYFLDVELNNSTKNPVSMKMKQTQTKKSA